VTKNNRNLTVAIRLKNRPKAHNLKLWVNFRKLITKISITLIKYWLVSQKNNLIITHDQATYQRNMMMRSSLPGSCFPARIVAVLAFAAMFTGAASQNCRATYRPVTVDMNEEENRQGKESIEMYRYDVNYVELSTLDGKDVYVEPMGCPLANDGTLTHRRPKRTLTLGCADPDDCPDAATFWSDPLQYACGEKEVNDLSTWPPSTKVIMDCSVKDRNQQYWEARPPNVCCPIDKPYLYSSVTTTTTTQMILHLRKGVFFKKIPTLPAPRCPCRREGHPMA